VAYKTVYKPKNPHKYLADANNIKCDSLWERQFCRYCDETSSILEWCREPFPIPYISPKDGRKHRYYIDFYVKSLNKDGTEDIYLVEVKPHKETKPPKPRERKSKKFLMESLTYAVNTAKWDAARNVCDMKGWKFLILDEKNANFK